MLRSKTFLFPVFVAVLLALASPLWRTTSGSRNSRRRFRRVYNTVRALYSLATMPAEDWSEYRRSVDQVMVKDRIETAEDERLVAAWYKVVNFFCDLGNLEKMYIPPLVDPELGLEDNQLLLENKMALSAASDFWNASYINAVGDTLPDTYRQRYVVNLHTGQKSILPVGTTKIPPGYEQREMNILELGCGKGRILYDMIEYTGGTGAGINIDESQLINGMKFALERGLWPRKLNVMYGSYNDGLPFGDGSVDFVYEIGAFTYVIDKSAVFREIFRVLRPGGAFCYNDWTASESFDPADGDQADKIMRIKKFSGLIELHRPSELAAVAERAGFEVLWNGHGGHNAVPSSGLLSQMNLSFGFADAFVTFLIKYKLLPKRLVKGWELLRGGGGVSILRESMDSKWLDIGHVFLIRKPFE